MGQLNCCLPPSSQGPQTVLFKKETTSEPSVTITSLPQISESEPETSGTPKGSSVEEYLIIGQQEGRRRRRGEGGGEGGGLYEGDEKSSGSPSSNAPILSDMLASRYIYMYMQWFLSLSVWAIPTYMYIVH